MYADTHTVQVDGMLRIQRVSEAKKEAAARAYGSSSRKPGNCKLDTLVGLQAIDATRRKEIRSICRTAQNLE